MPLGRLLLSLLSRLALGAGGLSKGVCEGPHPLPGERSATPHGSDRRYRQLWDHCAEAQLVVEAATGTLLDCNRRAEQVLARPAEALIGHHYSELSVPEEREIAVGLFATAAASRGGRVAGLHLAIGDGTVLAVEVTAVEASLDGHRVLLLSLRERCGYEADPALGEDRAHAYLEATRAPLLALDREGRVQLCNRCCRELLGYSSRELIGSDWVTLCVAPGARTAARIQIKAHFSTPCPQPLSVEIVTRGGELLVQQWLNRPLHNQDGAVDRVLYTGSHTARGHSPPDGNH